MKTIIAAILMSLTVTGVTARSLNLTQGTVTYSYNEDEMGVANFEDGKTITIAGRTYTIGSDMSMKVVDEAISNNLVLVNYDKGEAHITISGNIAPYVSATLSGAYVTLDQSSDVNDAVGEITYRLSGISADGSFKLNGSYKCTVELNGLTLTSAKGAAIDIQNGKRTNLKVLDGTVNKLVDAAGGSQKAALYCKGHMEFKQKGSLYVTGNTAHAISAKELITLKNSKIYIDKAIKDGINCNQSFAMESGTIDISGVGDDCIQVSFKDDTDREAADTGSFTMTGGTITASATAIAAKAIKADGDVTISGGTISATTSGDGMWDSTALKTKSSSCISADGAFTLTGGTLDLKSTGSGGKGISCNGVFNSTGGNVTIATTGGLYYNNGKTENKNYTGNTDNVNASYRSSPKGIKGDMEVNIDGGTFVISTKANGGEGIESKTTLTITNGDIKIRSYDDGLNSSGNMYIKGGVIDVISTKCDALDSNASMYLSGGTIMAFGATGPEEGLDIDSGTMDFTGGYILGVGGRNTTPNKSSSTQPYVSGTLKVAAGADLTVKDNTGNVMHTFTIPTDFVTGTAVIVSIPGMEKGQSYTLTCGTASVKLTAAQYSTSGGGGGGGRWP